MTIASVKACGQKKDPKKLKRDWFRSHTSVKLFLVKVIKICKIAFSFKIVIIKVSIVNIELKCATVIIKRN